VDDDGGSGVGADVLEDLSKLGLNSLALAFSRVDSGDLVVLGDSDDLLVLSDDLLLDLLDGSDSSDDLSDVSSSLSDLDDSWSDDLNDASSSSSDSFDDWSLDDDDLWLWCYLSWSSWSWAALACSPEGLGDRLDLFCLSGDSPLDVLDGSKFTDGSSDVFVASQDLDDGWSDDSSDGFSSSLDLDDLWCSDDNDSWSADDSSEMTASDNLSSLDDSLVNDNSLGDLSDLLLDLLDSLDDASDSLDVPDGLDDLDTEPVPDTDHSWSDDLALSDHWLSDDDDLLGGSLELLPDDSASDVNSDSVDGLLDLLVGSDGFDGPSDKLAASSDSDDGSLDDLTLLDDWGRDDSDGLLGGLLDDLLSQDSLDLDDSLLDLFDDFLLDLDSLDNSSDGGWASDGSGDGLLGSSDSDDCWSDYLLSDDDWLSDDHNSSLNSLLDCSSEFTDGNDSSFLHDDDLSLLDDSLPLDLLLNSGESSDVSHLSDDSDSASLDDLHDGWAHDSSVDNDWSSDDCDAWLWLSSWLSDSSDLSDDSLGLLVLDSHLSGNSPDAG